MNDTEIQIYNRIRAVVEAVQQVVSLIQKSPGIAETERMTLMTLSHELRVQHDVLVHQIAKLQAP